MLSPLLLLALPLLQADDRVKIDNEFIRVLKVTDVPHQKTPLHSHQFNRVMVYLNSGNLDVRYEDGKTTHQKWRAQDVD